MIQFRRFATNLFTNNRADLPQFENADSLEVADLSVRELQMVGGGKGGTKSVTGANDESI